jgi:putative ABC transport system permease protein
MIGRGFLPEDECPGRTNVLVLCHDVWKRRFAGDPAAVGQKILLHDTAYTFVGVMPPQFFFFNRQMDFLSPMEWNREEMRQYRDARWLRVMARLKPGDTLQQAQARADVFSENLARDHPETNRGWKVRLRPLAEDSAGPLRPALLMLMSGVGCVLLITCLNVANLILVQVSSRGRELAVRSALGASRMRLVRQLLTESLMLSAVGGLLGMGLAWILIRHFQTLLPDPYTYGKYLVQVEAIGMDSRVAGFAVLVAFLTGAIFGLVPALRASQPDLNEILKDTGKGSAGGRQSRKIHDVLVIAEVSLALVMVAGAFLLVRSFIGLLSRGPGLRAANVITLETQLPTWEIRDRLLKRGGSRETWSKVWNDEIRSFNRRVLERLQALPGVRSAGLTGYIPMTGWYWRETFTVEGRTVDASSRSAPPKAIGLVVSPAYFETIGLPLLGGRLFSNHDTPDSVGVVVISQEMAQRYWPAEDPLGKRMQWGDPSPDNPWLTVVGVVGDVREDGISKPPQPTFYAPLEQRPAEGFFIAIRTQSDPLSVMPALRRALKEVHPKIPIYRLRKLEDVVLDSTWRLRYSMLLLGGLAGLSLILAVIGVYGVLSYAVADRTQEIGVRMALGASQHDIVRLIVRRGLGLVAIGVLIGLAAACILTRSLLSLLFGVSPLDPLTFALVVLVLIVSGWLACYLPARRASRVNPMTALRYE